MGIGSEHQVSPTTSISPRRRTATMGRDAEWQTTVLLQPGRRTGDDMGGQPVDRDGAVATGLASLVVFVCGMISVRNAILHLRLEVSGTRRNSMLDHVIVTVRDFTRSIAFYAQALKPLGITDFLDYKGQGVRLRLTQGYLNPYD